MNATFYLDAAWVGVEIPRKPLMKNLARDWDTWFLTINAINWLAKTASEEWYEVKDQMLLEALSSDEMIHGLWYRDGIVYYEGLECQVSFHLVEEESIDRWEASDYNRSGEGMDWSGVYTQGQSLEILVAHLSEVA